MSVKAIAVPGDLVTVTYSPFGRDAMAWKPDQLGIVVSTYVNDPPYGSRYALIMFSRGPELSEVAEYRLSVWT